MEEIRTNNKAVSVICENNGAVMVIPDFDNKQNNENYTAIIGSKGIIIYKDGDIIHTYNYRGVNGNIKK